MGGPGYYIQNGIGRRWFAILFAVLITFTFGIAYNPGSVQYYFGCIEGVVRLFAGCRE